MILFFRLKHMVWSAALGLITLLGALMGQNFLLPEPDFSQVDLTVLNHKKIFIDPGHGGVDSGTVHHNKVEKDLNLAISLKLGQILEQQGAQVSYSRTTDTDYYTRGKGGKRNDLLQRVAMLEQFDPDCYVSIHMNAIGLSNQQGAQVFYSTKNSDSPIFAEILQKALKDFPTGNKRQAKKDLDILLLNATNKPGVLVEAGYLTNLQEAERLANPDYQQQLADQLARGMAYHFTLKVAR